MSGADRDIHVDGRAEGAGRVYQVAHGTQNIHHHYPAPLGREPLDPAGLRLWVERMTVDYRQRTATGDMGVSSREAARHRERLDTLAGTVNDEPGRARTDDVLRRLLAAGAMQYLFRVGPLPAGTLPEHIVLDFTVFALWPVVGAATLPAGWEKALAEITSPRLGALVARARDAPARREDVTVQAFARAIADKPFAHGVLGLLDDLGDPRRGGTYLTPMALAAGLPAPPPGNDPKKVLAWMLAGAAAGLGITKVDAAVDLIWDWVHDGRANPLSHALGGATPAPGGDDEGGTTPAGRRGGLLDDIVDELLR